MFYKASSNSMTPTQQLRAASSDLHEVLLERWSIWYLLSCSRRTATTKSSTSEFFCHCKWHALSSIHVSGYRSWGVFVWTNQKRWHPVYWNLRCTFQLWHNTVMFSFQTSTATLDKNIRDACRHYQAISPVCQVVIIWWKHWIFHFIRWVFSFLQLLNF